MATKSRSNVRPRRAASLVAVGALGLAAAFAARPASAAPQALELGLRSGTLSVGEQSFVLPTDGGFSGTLDDETGALAGTFDFPVIQANVTDPFPVVVFATLTQNGTASGSVDLSTGEAELAASLNIGLEVRTTAGAVLVGGDCGIGPIDLAFAGDYDASTDTLTLQDEGFVLPASTGCSSPGIDFGPIINDLLGGATSADLVLSSGDGPVTTTAPPTPTSGTTPTTGGPRPSTPATTPGGPTPTTPGTPPPAEARPSAPVGSQEVRLTILDRDAAPAETEDAPAQMTG